VRPISAEFAIVVNGDFQNSGTLAKTIRDSYNTVTHAAVNDELAEALAQLHKDVATLLPEFDGETAELMSEDLSEAAPHGRDGLTR
jgi:hypothetical protein